MAEENDTVEEAQGGGKKKLIFIVAGVVLLLAGGAVAAFFLLAGEAEPGADGETVAEEPAVEQGDPVYHKLDPEFIVNLPPGGSAKMLQLSLQVMTRTPGVLETLQANDPMIRHHLINLLEQQEAATLMTAEGKQALQQAVLELISGKLKELREPGEIKDVYFTQFVMQ